MNEIDPDLRPDAPLFRIYGVSDTEWPAHFYLLQSFVSFLWNFQALKTVLSETFKLLAISF